MMEITCADCGGIFAVEMGGTISGKICTCRTSASNQSTVTTERDAAIRELGEWARKAGNLEAQLTAALKERDEAREKGQHLDDQLTAAHERLAQWEKWLGAPPLTAFFTREQP